MHRFEFKTNTVPEEAGEGVVFEDGRAAYREYVGGVWTSVIETSVQTIHDQYGAQDGFEFKWLDGQPKEKSKLERQEEARSKDEAKRLASQREQKPQERKR